MIFKCTKCFQDYETSPVMLCVEEFSGQCNSCLWSDWQYQKETFKSKDLEG